MPEEQAQDPVEDTVADAEPALGEFDGAYDESNDDGQAAAAGTQDGDGDKADADVAADAATPAGGGKKPGADAAQTQPDATKPPQQEAKKTLQEEAEEVGNELLKKQKLADAERQAQEWLDQQNKQGQAKPQQTGQQATSGQEKAQPPEESKQPPAAAAPPAIKYTEDEKTIVDDLPGLEGVATKVSEAMIDSAIEQKRLPSAGDMP